MGNVDPGLDAALCLLGVGADADRDQLSRAYRRLARDAHPDVSPRTDAATRFDALARAYRIAAEASRRQEERGPASTARQAHGSEHTVARRQAPAAPAQPSGWADAPGLWIVVGPVRVDPLPDQNPLRR